MKICKNCQKELPDNVKFCSGCGTPVEAEPAVEEVVAPEVVEAPEVVAAPEVVEEIEEEVVEEIVEEIVDEVVDEEYEDPYTSFNTAAVAEKVKGAGGKKLLVFAGIAVVAIAVVIGIIALISSMAGGSSSADGVFDPLYLKDGEIYYSEFSKDDPIELTSRLYGGEEVENYDIASDAYDIANFMAINEKGTRVFFPDKADDRSEGATLYYRDVNKKDSEAVKIDAKITQYAINPAGTKIAYIKDDNLYISDLEEKEKIASDVSDFMVLSDLSKIAYQKDENLYLWQGEDGEKIASDISYVYDYNEDMSEFYYVKDESLYKHDVKKDEKEKLVSDLYSVVCLYESGEMYYTKADEEEVALIDYVDDDMYEQDLNMEYPEYPDWWDYDTDEAYDAAWEEYELAYEEYYKKETRDSIRSSLENWTITVSEYSLYYFDGEESVEITDQLASGYGYSCNYDEPLMIASIREEADIPKVKLSEVEYYDQVYYDVMDAMESSSTYSLVTKDQMTPIEIEDISSLRLAPDASAIYFLSDVNDEGEGDLYKAKIQGGKVQEAEQQDDDVYNMYFRNENDLVYFKNYDDENWCGDLYLNGNEVDYDVRMTSIVGYDGGLLYYTDWDSEDGCGTLNLYKNGESEKVADDVVDYSFTADGGILILNDYSTKHSNGTISLYKNGKSEKVDDDVIALLEIDCYGVKYFDWYPDNYYGDYYDYYDYYSDYYSDSAVAYPGY